MPRRMSVAPGASHTRTPEGTGIIPAARPAPTQRRRADRFVHPHAHAARQLDFDQAAPVCQCRLQLRPLAGMWGAIGDPNRDQSNAPLPRAQRPRHASPTVDQARADAMSTRHIPHAIPGNLGLPDHHLAETALVASAVLANNLNSWLPLP